VRLVANFSPAVDSFFFQPENVALLQGNAELNSLQDAVNIEALDWTKPIPPELAGPWDVVLAADCVFWEYLFEPLIDTLVQLASKSTRVYISMTHRFGRTKTFLALLEQKCSRIEKMETAGMFNTDVYRIH
jgi:predicted nicotinamide N-methyase